MYESVIEIAEKISTEMSEQLENHVVEVVHSYGVNVDKDALVRALQYDRDQYNKGYRDAKAEIIHCEDCKHYWTHRCMDSMPTQWCDLNQTFYNPERDYCSLAERREVAINNGNCD